MSIFNYEQASLFGAIDSAALADGEPLHAHVLRAMAMSANRLTLKGQHLLTLPWATGNNAGTDPDYFSGYGLSTWQRVIGPVPIFKRPLLNEMTVKLEMTITADAVYQVGAGTLASPFTGPSSENIVQFPGTGTPQVITIENVRLREDTQEEIEIWVCACDTSSLADEATYGPENRGTFESLGDGYMFDTSAAWNMSSDNDNLATGGHLLSLEDLSNNRLLPFRRIISVGAMGGVAGVSTNLQFFPYLTPLELDIAHSGGNYSIYKVSDFTIHSIAAASEGRTL